MGRKHANGAPELVSLGDLSSSLPERVSRVLPKVVPGIDGMPAALPPCFAEVWRRRSSKLAVHESERAALEAVAASVPSHDTSDRQASAGVYLAALVTALRSVTESPGVRKLAGNINESALLAIVQPKLSKKQRRKANRASSKESVSELDKRLTEVRIPVDGRKVETAELDTRQQSRESPTGDGDNTTLELISSLVYLISLALRDVRVALVTLKFEEILGVVEEVARLRLCGAACRHAAAAISSTISILDSKAWTKPIVQRAFLRIIVMCADGEPKTRRRARDAVQALLDGPRGDFIAKKSSSAVALHLAGSLKDLLSTLDTPLDSTSTGSGQTPVSRLVFIITTVSVVAPALEPQDTTAVAKELVVVAASRVQHVSVFAFRALSDLFTARRINHAVDGHDREDDGPSISRKGDSLESRIPVQELARIVQAVAQISMACSPSEELLVAYVTCLGSGAVTYLNAHEHSVPPSHVLEASLGSLLDCLDPTVVSQKTMPIVAKTLSDVVGHRWSRTSQAVFTSLRTLFGYRFKSSWPVALSPLRRFLEMDRCAASDVLADDMKDFVSEVLVVRDQSWQRKDRLRVNVATGILAAVLRGGGVKAVLACVQLKRDEKHVLSNAWILPLLKQHVRKAHISTYMTQIQPLWSHLKERASRAREQELVVDAKNSEMLALQLYDIFSSFCHTPADLSVDGTLLNIFDVVARGFGDASEQMRLSAVASLRNVSLSIANSGPNEELTDVRDKYSKHLRKCFPMLLTCIQECSADHRALFLEAVTQACGACGDSKLVIWFLRRAIRQLLEFSVGGAKCGGPDSEASGECRDLGSVRHACADVAIAIAESRCVPNNCAEIDFLERTMSPLFMDPSDAILQKKAYRATALLVSLGVVSKSRESGLSFIKNAAAASGSVSSSAKASRIGLIHALVVMTMGGNNVEREFLDEITEGFLAEVVLGTRDVSDKTRVASFGALSSFAQAWHAKSEDQSQGLEQFLSKLCAGLAGKSVNMLSATLTGVSHFVHEFRGEAHMFPSFGQQVDSLYSYCSQEQSMNVAANDASDDADMEDRDGFKVQPGPISILLRHSAREVQKAALGAVKVATGALSNPPSRLCSVLPGLVPGLVAVAAKSKKKEIRLRVRIILERLLRKCGRDELEAVFPSEHMKLLNAVRKQHSRDLAKKHASRESRQAEKAEEQNAEEGLGGGESSGNSSDDMEDMADSDSDVEREVLDGNSLAKTKPSSRGSRSGSLLVRDNSSNVVDLLDMRASEGFVTSRELSDASRRAVAERHKCAVPRKKSEVKLSEDGRPIFEEDVDTAGDSLSRKKLRVEFEVNQDDHERTLKRKRDDFKSSSKRKRVKGAYGEEYRGRRGADGDMKKPGMPDPYAYVPLGPSVLGCAGNSLLGQKAAKGDRSRNRTATRTARRARRNIPAKR